MKKLVTPQSIAPRTGLQESPGQSFSPPLPGQQPYLRVLSQPSSSQQSQGQFDSRLSSQQAGLRVASHTSLSQECLGRSNLQIMSQQPPLRISSQPSSSLQSQCQSDSRFASQQSGLRVFSQPVLPQEYLGQPNSQPTSTSQQPCLPCPSQPSSSHQSQVHLDSSFADDQGGLRVSSQSILSQEYLGKPNSQLNSQMLCLPCPSQQPQGQSGSLSASQQAGLRVASQPVLSQEFLRQPDSQPTSQQPYLQAFSQPSSSQQSQGHFNSQLSSQQLGLPVPSHPPVSREFVGLPTGLKEGNLRQSLQCLLAGTLSHLCGGTDSQLSTILQVLQTPQHQELGLEDCEPPAAIPGIGLQQQDKRRRRACKKANCTHCNAAPCGVCKPCKHPERRNKCILR